MHKIFFSRIVFMCIFALTHHLPTISASASDLSLYTISSSSSSSSATTTSSAGVAATDIATAKSSDASTKTTDLFAIENDVAAKEISIAALSSAVASSSPLSSSSVEHQDKLATHRQTRSLFYSYPNGGGLYGNLYNGYGVGIGGGVTYNNYYPYSSYSYSYTPTFYKFWGVYNPYYGYPRVIYG
ncbi:hypothetical protein FF38_11852 [Lucilia cuprina]|uniref:Uncharacterized protein n=1 Tax=Lucilia cuprina TaxID=7375 RepID=A0A0L0C0N8_LUCCU|nr:hypothetical protein FF38_11852 [Lucilia cuprina]